MESDYEIKKKDGIEDALYFLAQAYPIFIPDKDYYARDKFERSHLYRTLSQFWDLAAQTALESQQEYQEESEDARAF